jgi:rhamnogalacturonan endolyase
VADVDGDGQYELILKWEPSNAHDNAHDGYTGPTLIDCYKLSPSSPKSNFLWRIDLGRNIRSGAHYVPFIVYDFDGDGRAELMVKTADGTRDGMGTVLGDSTADYRHAGTGPAPTRGRRQPWAKPKEGRILDGPEYITIFDGATGRALDTKPYIPERGNLAAWGDDKGNRSERYLAAVGYLDGQHASGLFCRGYYTRTVIAAWDWNGHELKNRWTFDTDEPEWKSYAGQGNHNLRVADVDGDGCDELTYGSMAVDHDGRGLYNTGMGHGDALHLTAFDPKTDELQVWDCHENRRDGSDLRNARTGEVLFQIKSQSDVGRALAADIDPTNPGVEMWSTDSHGIRNIKGEVVGKANDADDPQHNNMLVMNGRWLSINFAIWWDGDLLRELLDRERVTKYDWERREITELMHFEGRFNNGTKSNPCLQADILGDWREEVILRNEDSTELRLYTTTIPTPYRIDCLMQDIPYRLSVATENVGYNQPPETGFYLGPDKTDYTK